MHKGQHEELCAKGQMLVLLAGVIVAEEQRVLRYGRESWGRARATGIEVSVSEKGWKQLLGEQICETRVDAVSMFGFECSLPAPQSWCSLGTQNYQNAR